MAKTRKSSTSTKKKTDRNISEDKSAGIITPVAGTKKEFIKPAKKREFCTYFKDHIKLHPEAKRINMPKGLIYVETQRRVLENSSNIVTNIHALNEKGFNSARTTVIVMPYVLVLAIHEETAKDYNIKIGDVLHIRDHNLFNIGTRDNPNHAACFFTYKTDKEIALSQDNILVGATGIIEIDGYPCLGANMGSHENYYELYKDQVEKDMPDDYK